MIAVISDIHGNLEALSAVLKDVSSIKGLELVLCCGDLVDYGPQPEEVVERIKAEGIPCVQGNHDRAVGESFPLQGKRSSRAI